MMPNSPPIAPLSIGAVLLMDDDPILRAIYRAFFEERQVNTIHEAGDGKEALDIIQQHGEAIDFILCDLNMPNMDGIQFLRKAKELNFQGHIGILSGEDQLVLKSAQRLAETHELKILGSLQKPFDGTQLDQLMSKLPCNQPAPVATRSNTDEILADVNEGNLRRAIAGGSIIPFYQPKVTVNDRRVVGAEALARWLHPIHGLISPAMFIPLAEESGLIDSLTDVILLSCIADLSRWKQKGVDLRVSMNLHTGILRRLEYPDYLHRKVLEANLTPADLVLEITESSILRRESAPMEVLARLCMMGFKISIDDFGTGFSNIEQLREFPYSELKIDQSFIKNATRDRFSKITVEASIVLGRELGMRLVAEGVETPRDWQFVERSGIDEVQGFLIARPMSAADFEIWFSANHGRVPDELLRVQQDGPAPSGTFASTDTTNLIVPFA